MQVNKNCFLYLYHVLKFIKYFLTSFTIKEKHKAKSTKHNIALFFFSLRNMNLKNSDTMELRPEIWIAIMMGGSLFSCFFLRQNPPDSHFLISPLFWVGSAMLVPELLWRFVMAVLDFWHTVLPGFLNKLLMHFLRAFPGPASPAQHMGTIRDMVEKSMALL